MSPSKKIDDLNQLKLIANHIRQDIIIALNKAGSGHPGGSLGMADVFTALYFNVLKHDSKNPFWEERDRFILSNGHICPVLYATLANAGYFSKKELWTLRKFGSRLQGHPHRTSLPGLETSSGPLGSGLSQAVGMALALKLDMKKNYIYCMMSDGEQDAGQTWEAAMLGAKYKLDHLIAIIDDNGIQIDGTTTKIMPLEPLAEKYRAFGWEVLEIDAHNLKQIFDALNKAKNYSKPVVILAHSVLGKGVSFMEGSYDWHGKAPNEEETKQALKELAEERRKIEHA